MYPSSKNSRLDIGTMSEKMSGWCQKMMSVWYHFLKSRADIRTWQRDDVKKLHLPDIGWSSERSQYEWTSTSGYICSGTSLLCPHDFLPTSTHVLLLNETWHRDGISFGYLYDVRKQLRSDVGFRSVPTFFLTSSRYRAENFCCLGTLVGTPLVGLIEYTSPKLQRLVTYKSSHEYKKAEQDIASLHFLSIRRRLIGFSGRATYYPFERQYWKISE